MKNKPDNIHWIEAMQDKVDSNNPLLNIISSSNIR